MRGKFRRPKGEDGVLSSLDVAIGAVDLAKEAPSSMPAKGVFGSTSVLLTTIRDSVIDEEEYVKLGLSCADICKALDRGINGRRVDKFSQSVLSTIEQLTIIVAEIQENIIKRNKRNAISRHFHKKDDNEAVAAWSLNLNRILRALNTELGTNNPDIRGDPLNANEVIPVIHRDVSDTQATVSDIHRTTLKNREDKNNQNTTHASAPGQSPPPVPRSTQGTVPDVRHDVVKARAVISEVHRDVVNTQVMVRKILKGQEGAGDQDRSVLNSVPGESPPPPPRIFFGRNELIEKIVAFAERLTPIALVGAGGIGKTSVVLTILHDDRIKRRFGDERRFIRCDKFPASLPHFLRRLSKAIGASIENPEDLTPLRPFLSSKDMLIVFDNAESVLDPHVTSAEEIYAAVEELSQMGNICICITSRISTVPPDFEWLDIPTLSKEAACDTFHRIYKRGGRSDLVNNILGQLDFHPLSITLLATVAHHNKWDVGRLANEWGERRTEMLRTDHNRSLAAAIELSLSSPMFRELGSDARDLLGVIAFFPQGIDEDNIDWLFPAVSGRKNIFDKFCVLSLAYRSDGFITMLAPIRDYLSPKDPMSAPLLCSTKELYFTRLSVDVDPERPGFQETRWITLEDVNVEHLLDVFTTIDATSAGVWDACSKFLEHLYWHKPRLVVLGPKIEVLANDHPSKLGCLSHLSLSLHAVGNYAESKRLLTRASELYREQGDDQGLALTLRQLSNLHCRMDLSEEGISRAKEALEIYERLGDTVEQAKCLIELAWLLYCDEQLDAAEEAASRAIDLFPEEGGQSYVCRCHHVLGNIYHSEGEVEKATHHLEVALGIASPLKWLNLLSCIHLSLVDLFTDEGRFDDAHTHVEHAKLHAVDDHDTHLLARAMERQAVVWRRQDRFEEAKSEASRALDAFEKLGAASDVEAIWGLLRQIEHDACRSDDDDRAAKSE